MHEEPIVLETGPSPRWAFVLLHGLGADGGDLLPAAEALRPAAPLRFLLPHAPVRPVTLNGGLPMRAWFDVVAIDPEAPEDTAGLEASAAAVEALVADQARQGIPPGRVFPGGFSQGGALALYAGLRRTAPLAGLACLSGFLPRSTRLGPAAPRTPVFMAHGERDPVVPPELARRARRRLEAAGVPLAFHGYDMEHTLCAAELADLEAWLDARLRDSPAPG